MSEANEPVTQSVPTRDAHSALMEGIKNLEKTVKEKGDVAFAVEVGSLLWDLINAADSTLKKIKEQCRDEAWEALEGHAGTHTIEGIDIGEASVNIPRAIWKLKKGKDMESLKTAMGNNFGLFFEEIVTHKPRSEWDTLLSQPELDPLYKRLLMDSVNRDEPTPRVSFRRNKLPKGER